MRIETVRGQHHRANLEQLHVTNDPALLILLGQLTGGGGKQEERDDEQRRRQIGVERHRVVAQPHLERHQHHQRIAERIVIERTQRLGPEERRKAPLAQQCELAHAVLRFWRCRNHPQGSKRLLDMVPPSVRFGHDKMGTKKNATLSGAAFC